VQKICNLNHFFFVMFFLFLFLPPSLVWECYISERLINILLITISLSFFFHSFLCSFLQVCVVMTSLPQCILLSTHKKQKISILLLSVLPFYSYLELRSVIEKTSNISLFWKIRKDVFFRLLGLTIILKSKNIDLYCSATYVL